MNYLLDRKAKTKKNKILKITIIVVVLLVLFFLRTSIFNGLSYVSGTVFRPVLSLGVGVGNRFSTIGAYFSSKNTLYKENMDLKARIDRDVADRNNYDSVVTENNDLKEILGRKTSGINMTLATILEKPNQSPYDTIVIDAGADQGVKAGNKVFALGNIPIGRVVETYPNFSKVILFSNSGEKTQVIISRKNVFAELIGRGGNNFEMVLPRDMVLWKDDQVVLPGITPYVVGTVQTVISDPREAFQKALIVAPVNIQNIKFVEVER